MIKLFPLNIVRLRALNTKWRTAFTSLRTVIPPGLGVIHLAALSNGDENPPIRNAQIRPTGLMQIPQRRGRQLGFKDEDLKKSSNNIYAWAKMTNQDARTLYDLNKIIWTSPNYDFWLTVHLMFLLQFSFSLLPSGTLSMILNDIAQMKKTDHIGPFSYRDMQIIAMHLNTARKFLVMLDGPDHATSAFGAEMTVPNHGSVMNILQRSV
jgi:hypothetical protein